MLLLQCRGVAAIEDCSPLTSREDLVILQSNAQLMATLPVVEELHFARHENDLSREIMRSPVLQGLSSTDAHAFLPC